jgi:aerobic carbon-monoxide dehydrogenase medium subunit
MVAVRHPKTLAEALELLLSEPDALPLAGGASMVAMMNAGLIEPTTIVCLRDIAELQGIFMKEDGGVRIGAMTRHRDTACDQRIAGSSACVRHAAASIASPPVRNVGTIGGSLALSDPAADYPAALVAAGAQIELAGADGFRFLDAGAFFLDWYTTALEPGELIWAVHLPCAAGGNGIYEKFARTAGDFAIASIAISIGAEGSVRAAVGACGPRPVFSEEANALLGSSLGDAQRVREAGELLAAAADPTDDVRASAEYRRMLIPRLLSRAVERLQLVQEVRA